MFKNKVIFLSLLSLSLAFGLSSFAFAGNVKKMYINVAQEGQKAQASDIPANYGNIENGMKTVAYNNSVSEHGSILGAKKVEGPQGFNSALSFNEDGANDDYVKFPIKQYMPSTAFTFETWVRTTKKTWQWWISYAHPSVGDNEVHFYFAANGNFAPIFFQNTGTTNTGVNFNDGKWHHLAITWNSANGVTKVYKDGNPTPAWSGTYAQGKSMPSGGFFYLGQEQDSTNGTNLDPGQAFQGAFDEFRIWNVERTGQEISQNFNKEITQHPNLITYLNFN